MAMKLVGDVSIKTGEYTDGNGQKRGRYTRVGSEMVKDDGAKLLAIEPMFLAPSVLMQMSAAGIDTSRPIYLSVFSREERGNARPAPQAQAQKPKDSEELNDDIPF